MYQFDRFIESPVKYIFSGIMYCSGMVKLFDAFIEFPLKTAWSLNSESVPDMELDPGANVPLNERVAFPMNKTFPPYGSITFIVPGLLSPENVCAVPLSDRYIMKLWRPVWYICILRVSASIAQ